jgi:hypothetical protein
VDRSDAWPRPDAGDAPIEPRWPVALVVFTFIVLTVVLRLAVPRRESIGPHWIVPAVEIGLLVVLFAASPDDVRADARWFRRLSISLILLLVTAALASTAILIVELVTGAEVAQSADSLLASGTLVWAGNALVFGLLYWQLDSGGPRARYRAERAHLCGPSACPPRPGCCTSRSAPTTSPRPSASPWPPGRGRRGTSRATATSRGCG